MTSAQNATNGWRLGYRPALDGLRGIAALMVMGSHFDVPFMLQGGVVGVGIFFALSGFLITSLLIEERARTGRIDLLAFYGRRARRLLPALYAVVAFWLGASVLLGVLDSQLTGLVTASTYVTNWAVRFGIDAADMEHTWTLAVEEQFYLVWPIGIIAAGSAIRARRWVGVAIAIIAIMVLGRHGIALFAGCLLAIGLRRGLPLQLPGWAGMAAFAALAFLMATSIAWSSGQMLPAVVATVLLAALVGGENFLTRALAWAPLRGAGRISYALYLWHPVLIGGAILAGYPKGPLVNIILIGLTFAAAILSWRFVESPFLHRRQPARHGASDEQALPQGVSPRQIEPSPNTT